MKPEKSNKPKFLINKLLTHSTTILFYFSILFFIIPFKFTDTPLIGNWYQQFLPNLNNMPISDIFFLDSLTGYAVTGDMTPNDTNYILKTTNGGDNWITIYQDYKNFFKVKFINSNTGFVCGGFNSIGQGLLKTINGGNNWSPINAPLSIWFDDMSVLNENLIWLVQRSSGDGGVFRTTNGGVNWQQQLNLGSLNPTNVYFYNASTGYISNNTGAPYVRRTTDSGSSWTVNVSGEGFTDMYFVDNLTGWRAYGTMKKTTNGGLNWVNQTLPFGGQIITSSIGRFSVLNRDTIWGVGGQIFYGGSQTRGIIFRTTDGGNNWQFQAPDTAYNIFNYYHIKFVNKNNGWAYSTVRGVHTTTGGDPIWLTGIKQISSEIPKEYGLYQNYPNPFNPKTLIKYQIVNSKEQRKAFVQLKIYDITGKELITLVNQEQPTGTYEVDFSGAGYSSGVYFYSLIVDNKIIDTKRMILVK